MTSRRTFLIAGTGALASSVAACGGGVRDATSASAQPQSGGPDPIPTTSQIPSSPVQAQAAPASASAPVPAPAPAPPTGTGGTLRQLGTQTLAAYLNAVRTALPEGLTAATLRMMPTSGYMAFSGGTIWRDKFSFGASGGHGDSFDDGHYALDLATGNWETLLFPSTVGQTGLNIDMYGEWIANRPASQHSNAQLITVGDDIILGYTTFAGYLANCSRQAHRWNGALGTWERYGTLSGRGDTAIYFVHYDLGRNRIWRLPGHVENPYIEWIPAGDPTASWTQEVAYLPAAFEIYCNGIGYHPLLDCFVAVSQHDYPNRAWVLDAGNLAGGWVEVTVTGVTLPTPMTSGGMEYIPPKGAFASANWVENNVFYYLTPSGTKFQSWAWSKETFTGSTTAGAWMSDGTPMHKFRWSSLLNGLVCIKDCNVLPEVFTPSAG